MTANLTIKRGTYQIYMLYRDSFGVRRQKWFDTGLYGDDVQNKKRAIEIKNTLFARWRPILEPNITDLTVEEQVLQNSRENKGSVEVPHNFADLLLEWLHSSRGHLQISTYQMYYMVVTGVIEPYFRAKGYSVDEITVSVIEEYHDYLLMRGRSLSTVRKHNSNIASTLNYAIKKELIKFNPAYIVFKPKPPQRPINYYDIHELERLFRLIRNDPLWLVVVIAAYYGFRRGEIIGLTWQSIDFDNRTIAIRQTAYAHKQPGGVREQRVKTPLKSSNGYRTLPLIPEVEFALKLAQTRISQHQKYFGKKYDQTYSNYVCTNKYGKWIKLDYVTNHFRSFLKKNDLKVIRFHDLRHTCATLFYNNGVDLLRIKEWLGHANIQTTSIYTHVNYYRHLETAETANNIFPSFIKDDC